jgi:hypothetical protein
VVLDPAIRRACLGLAELDCVRALEAAATLLTEADPPVGYVEVGPFACQTGQGCEGSLIARPAGRVLFEFAAADSVEVTVQLEADGELALERMQAFGVRLAPSSLAGQLTGPIPFSLGHCGLWSGIDVDGSWWDPVGLVNADHGDMINAADGTFAPADPNHATFSSAGGFVVNLTRRAGEKWLPLCQ